VSAAAGAVGSAGVLVGVGIDVVEIERFRRALGRRPGLGVRLFDDGERADAAAAGDPVALLAARFAAKEAVMKALGTGLWAFPLRDVAVVRGPAGGVELHLGPQAAEVAERLGVTGWRLSLAIEAPVALAVALAGGRADTAEAGTP
jgi:holo-[acyl-carrier protein] synthase